MRSVLLVAQAGGLARRATAVLEAASIEVVVMRRPSFSSPITPSAVVVVAEELDGPWFSAVVDLLRAHGWGPRTVVLAEVTLAHIQVVRRVNLGALYPLGQLDGEFSEVLATLADGSRWEDRASARLQSVLGVTDELCARFVEEAFRYSLSCPAVGDLCQRRLYTSASNMRSRWKMRGLPGSPKQVLDRIAALRFAKARGRGASLETARAVLGVHSSTMYRLIRRVPAATPGEVGEDMVWAAIEEWADEA